MANEFVQGDIPGVGFKREQGVLGVGVVKMQVEIDIKSDRCNYPYCIHNVEGICYDDSARKACLGISLSVLCINKEVLHDRAEDKGCADSECREDSEGVSEGK